MSAALRSASDAAELRRGAAPAPSLSVVVCTYTDERWPVLEEAMAALRAQGTEELEVVLVIDHNPAFFERCRHAFPHAIVVENSDQRGLSGARNTGIVHTRGEVIAFLDDDAVPAPDWVNGLVEPYADRDVVGVGGSATPVWNGARPRWFPKEFDWVVGCSYRGLPAAQAPVRNLIGCNMSFRREVFDAVGLFTNGIGRVGKRPVGCEETELCIRLRQHRPEGVLVYDPGVRVRHVMSEDRKRWRYFRSRCYAEGLSKALVSANVGARDGLESERHYTRHTLPSGVARGCRESVRRREIDGALRAAAIVAGLLVTCAGYARGRVAIWLG